MPAVFTYSAYSSVPSGSYIATFIAIEEFKQKVAHYGDAVKLRFRINSGEYEGVEVSRICSQMLSTNSNLYQFAKGLLGRELNSGDRFDFAEHIGAKGVISVEKTDSGATRVATFMRAVE